MGLSCGLKERRVAREEHSSQCCCLTVQKFRCVAPICIPWKRCHHQVTGMKQRTVYSTLKKNVVYLQYKPSFAALIKTHPRKQEDTSTAKVVCQTKCRSGTGRTNEHHPTQTTKVYWSTKVKKEPKPPSSRGHHLKHISNHNKSNTNKDDQREHRPLAGKGHKRINYN